MKAVTVQYTVQPAFAERNKENVRAVMEALRASPIEGMLYSSYTMDDGLTFVHINIARDGETIKAIRHMPEFDHFLTELRASDLQSPPTSTDLDGVAAGFTL